MNGVIVVPTVATKRMMYVLLRWIFGSTTARPTEPQCGCARIAAIGYAKNTSVIATKTRSASLYEPRTTRSQMTAAAIGTEICGGTPASPSAAPTPTNSEMQIPRFANSTAQVEKSDQRGPYCSRISSASPLPVTAPIRAAISCTTMRLIVISTIIQRRS